MRFLSLAVVAMLPIAWLPAHAGPLDPFAGSWRGAEARGAGLEPNDLVVRIEPTDKGFELEWNAVGGGGMREDTFLSTDRNGVYAAGEGGGWLFNLFGDDEPGNPLKGQTLRWARTSGDALIIYRLDVHEDGGYVLDRYAWEAEGGELAFSFEQRRNDAPVARATGRLVRGGGEE